MFPIEPLQLDGQLKHRHATDVPDLRTIEACIRCVAELDITRRHCLVLSLQGLELGQVQVDR